MSLETVPLENKSVSALNVADTVDDIYIYFILPELSQLLVASLSCEPHFFTGRYSEPCCFSDTVSIVMLY